jgi:hypothetical protein
MTMVRAQEQQSQATTKVQRKSGASGFLVPYCSLSGNAKRQRGVAKNSQQETRTVASLFSLFVVRSRQEQPR